MIHDGIAIPFRSHLRPILLFPLLIFHLSFPDLGWKFYMGVSSLLPLIMYVCLDPTAPHPSLLSWIGRVNVAVPMT
jgi:hypothetical protein